MAAPPSGAAPLDVAFSTEVTTGGEVEPFAADWPPTPISPAQPSRCSARGSDMGTRAGNCSQIWIWFLTLCDGSHYGRPVASPGGADSEPNRAEGSR
jgi:hypothetical protein